MWQSWQGLDEFSPGPNLIRRRSTTYAFLQRVGRQSDFRTSYCSVLRWFCFLAPSSVPNAFVWLFLSSSCFPAAELMPIGRYPSYTRNEAGGPSYLQVDHVSTGSESKLYLLRPSRPQGMVMSSGRVIAPTPVVMNHPNPSLKK